MGFLNTGLKKYHNDKRKKAKKTAPKKTAPKKTAPKKTAPKKYDAGFFKNFV